MRQHALAWATEDPVGAELALTTLTARRLRATGVAVHQHAEHARSYRLDYRLETGPGFVTTRLRVVSRGAGWRRELHLARAAQGAWSVRARAFGEVDLPPPGGDGDALGGAVDCDLGFSPLTNSLPILRLDLLGVGGRYELLMAWVSVPDLGVRPYAQRYSAEGVDTLGRPVVRYEDGDGSFAADLAVDGEGFVLDYPGLARRIGGQR